MHIIESDADIVKGSQALALADPVMKQVLAATGTPPLRLRDPGFAGLMRIIAGQQLSVAAAASIWKKLCLQFDPMTPEAISSVPDDALRACGFSSPKIRTARHLCAALKSGDLALDGLGEMPVEEAISHLCQVKGVGPWTAEIYLMFCLGHGDIWPSGDLALQIAVQDAYALSNRPSAGDTIKIAEQWRPWRAVAARAFWAYYAVCRRPDSGIPV